jgi:hypothetical protein
MLATTTAKALLSNFSLVSSNVFTSFESWLFLIAGIMVAWFMVSSIKLLFFSDYPKKAKKLRDEGYKSDLF